MEGREWEPANVVLAAETTVVVVLVPVLVLQVKREEFDGAGLLQHGLVTGESVGPPGSDSAAKVASVVVVPALPV